MPAWVLVGETGDGEPVVITERVLSIETHSIGDVRAGRATPVIFPDRWAAKRVLRLRNEWRRFRCIRLDRL